MTYAALAAALQERYYEGKTHTDPFLEDPILGGCDELLDDVTSAAVYGVAARRVAGWPVCASSLARACSPNTSLPTHAVLRRAAAASGRRSGGCCLGQWSCLRGGSYRFDDGDDHAVEKNGMLARAEYMSTTLAERRLLQR